MVDAAHADVLAILTRAASTGGKTRLFADLHRDCDPQLLRALFLDTVNGAADARFARVVVVTPAQCCDEVARLVPGLRVIPQGDGDLGERMRTTMQELLDAGARRVALIGSDLPEIEAATIHRAFALLRDDPQALVLGPSRDGGYYLVAATRVPPVFDGIAWGTRSVLAETRARADAAGLRVCLLEPLGDVDTADDLRRAIRSGRAPQTAAWAAALGAGGPQNG